MEGRVCEGPVDLLLWRTKASEKEQRKQESQLTMVLTLRQALGKHLTCSNSFRPPISPQSRDYYYPHCIDEDTEARQGWVSRSRSGR